MITTASRQHFSCLLTESHICFQWLQLISLTCLFGGNYRTTQVHSNASVTHKSRLCASGVPGTLKNQRAAEMQPFDFFVFN